MSQTVRCRLALIFALALCCLPLFDARADEAAIRAAIREFFATGDAAKRRELAAQIEADGAYDRAKLSVWLHSAGLFKSMEPGRHTIQSGGERAAGGENAKSLAITLRIPRLYDENRAYPMIYALHGTGGDADGILAYVETLLGPRVDEFVVAAPTGYEQVALKSSVPYDDEHRSALRAIRRAAHIDANRVYAIGYSRGGHTCWTLAVTCADEFAGFVPVAGTFLLQEYDVLFETFLPNTAATNILCCYGAMDDAGPDGGPSTDGGIAGVNRFLKKIAEPLKLPIQFEEDASKGHAGIRPDEKSLSKLFESVRNPYPRKFSQAFRAPAQCAGYWVEPMAWSGAQWSDKPLSVEFRPGEKDWDKATQRKALGRTIRGLLGNIKVEVKDQTIRIDRKNVREARLWLGDDLVKFDRPIIVNDGGVKVYEGTVKPSLMTALSRAQNTFDFDGLHWAGIHVISGKKAKLIDLASGNSGNTP